MEQKSSSSILFGKQIEAWKALKNPAYTEILYGGAAGGGKSFLGCYFIIAGSSQLPGSRWLIGRAVLKTLKETTLKTFFEVVKTVGFNHKDFDYNAQKGIINWSNGSEILLKDLDHKPSDPEYNELGSLELTGAFIDEANQVSKKGKDIVKSRIRYKLDEFGLKPKLLMTCNPAKNWVYQDFYYPTIQETIEPYRIFIPAFMDDNPHIFSGYKENLLSLDEISKQRLLYGNWEYDADEMVLVDYNKIMEAFTNQYAPTGKKYITCDVARLGKDSTLVMVWDGWKIHKIERYGKTLVNETIDILNRLAKQFNIHRTNIIADADGIGGGVVDMIKCRSFVNLGKVIPDKNGIVPNFNSLKSQCAFYLADMINNNNLYICESPYKQLIIQELEQLKQRDYEGKLSLISKEVMKLNIGRSPDFLDAMIMRSWFDIQPTGSGVLKKNISLPDPRIYNIDRLL